MCDLGADVAYGGKLVLAGFRERVERAESDRELAGGMLADVANPERIDHTIQWCAAGLLDVLDDILGALFAHPFERFEIFLFQLIDVVEVLDHSGLDQLRY